MSLHIVPADITIPCSELSEEIPLPKGRGWKYLPGEEIEVFRGYQAKDGIIRNATQRNARAELLLVAMGDESKFNGDAVFRVIDDEEESPEADVIRRVSELGWTSDDDEINAMLTGLGDDYEDIEDVEEAV